MTHFRHHLCKPFHSNCSIEDRSTRKERTTLNDNCTGSFKKEANSNLSWFLVFSLSLSIRLQAIAVRSEAIASRLEAIAVRLETIALRLPLSFFLPPSLPLCLCLCLSLSLSLSLRLSLSLFVSLSLSLFVSFFSSSLIFLGPGL